MGALDREINRLMRQTAREWGIDLRTCPLEDVLAVWNWVRYTHPALRPYMEPARWPGPRLDGDVRSKVAQRGRR
jgi:hypothetical protein